MPDLTPELDLPNINSAHAPDCAHACKINHAIQSDNIYVSILNKNEQMKIRCIPFLIKDLVNIVQVFVTDFFIVNTKVLFILFDILRKIQQLAW